MDLEKKIHSCLEYLIDSHKETKEWDGEGILERSEILLLKNLTKIKYTNWTSKMSFNAWKILKNHEEDLLDFDIKFSDLERPDHIEEDKITPNDKNIVNIINNKFEIINPDDDVKKALNVYSEKIIVDFNLDNLYKLFEFLRSDKLRINKEYYKFINMYLNRIKIEDMYDGFDEKLKKNVKINLMAFQAIGCLYMLLNKRVILGDEMGLGKSVQSIVSVEMSKQKPCLIVCNNSLKFNWEIEINNTLKNQKINRLNKKSKKGDDFYIINYDSLHKYLDFIKELKPKSIIIDESHYLKDKRRKRTKSCLEAINNIEYRYALTGTSILKTPLDLIPQLKLINKLDTFGNENNYIEQFCGNSNTHWGRDNKKGASNLDILNRTLKETCFLRRYKKDVLPELPDKTVNCVYVDGNYTEYNKKLNEFLTLDRKEKIGKISGLRQAASMGKLESSKEWINNFLLCGKKLVVFAHHVKIIEELLKEYPNAAKITRDLDEEGKKENKERFSNDPNCNLIICSFKMANVGLTLTAASDILFVEMDWCAENNRQAEDRCHRITQKNAVNIWYLILKDTIDENILKVVKSKIKLINDFYNNSANNNENYNIIDSSIISDVVYSIEKENEIIDNKNNYVA